MCTARHDYAQEGGKMPERVSGDNGKSEWVRNFFCLPRLFSLFFQHTISITSFDQNNNSNLQVQRRWSRWPRPWPRPQHRRQLQTFCNKIPVSRKNLPNFQASNLRWAFADGPAATTGSECLKSICFRKINKYRFARETNKIDANACAKNCKSMMIIKCAERWGWDSAIKISDKRCDKREGEEGIFGLIGSMPNVLPLAIFQL